MGLPRSWSLPSGGDDIGFEPMLGSVAGPHGLESFVCCVDGLIWQRSYLFAIQKELYL